MSDSIWKKEISFKKKPKTVPLPAPTSPMEQSAPAEPAAKSESVWKKEIGFRRKPKPAAALPEPAAPVEQPEPEWPAKRESIWNKEIGRGRKAKAAAAEPVESGQDEFPLLEQRLRWWNKEIGGSRKKAEKAQQQDVVPEPAPAQPTAGREVAELVQGAVQSVSPEFAAPGHQLDPSMQRLYDSVVGRPVEEWGAPPAVPPAPIEPRPAAVVQPEPGVAAPDPEPVVPAPEPEAVVPAPEPEPEPEPAAQTEEPVPAAAEKSVWKKELSFRRKPKQEAPAPAAPELEPEPVGAEPAPAPASVVEAETAALEPAPAAAEKSMWKKELSFRRKPKQPKQVKQPKQEAEAPAAPEPSKSKSRRKLSGPTLRRPSLGRSSRGTDRLVGLKIGGSQIAAARVNNNGVAELVQLARAPLPGGIVVGGELRDPQALAASLRTFFAEHKLPRRGVRLGVASSRIGVRVFEISGIDDERQFVNAVRFRAQEALPIPLDEAVLDYRVLSEAPNEEGELVRRVLLVVAHKDLVERYVEACRLAGIQLAGIDLEAFALLRSLAPPAERNGSALVAVSIGHERTTLAVSDGRVCEFTRVIEWGGWAVNVALARVLDAAPGDVEQIKRDLSLVGDAAPAGLSPEQVHAAVDAVRRSIESLARDLVSSLQYYQGQPGSLGIGEIVLTGGTAHLLGLAEELERQLGVQVRVGDPLRRLKVSGPVAENDLGSLAIAIGLGIED